MAVMDDQDLDTIVGCTDGFRQGYIEGWAWRPNRPHDTVIVQLLVDGSLAGEVSACLPRPDLSTAGIGHGQHAFALPLVIEPNSPPILHLTVRAKDGPVLPSGEIEFATSEQTRAELALRRSVGHLESVFGAFTRSTPQPPRPVAAQPVPCLNFILYATKGQSSPSAVLGAPEYSYLFVMHGFRDLLRQIGVVHVVTAPAAADDIYQDCLDRGQSCLFLSFTPPQNTPLGLRCPTIPVIAWEFGSIPTGGWRGDKREDWRYVLRQTGRAITISGFAAKAIRGTMGEDYPVAFIPTPVWDRQAALRARLDSPGAIAPGGPACLEFDGFTWDSRQVTLPASLRAPPPPSAAARQAAMLLPMRGAQLALAEASAAEQRDIALAISRQMAESQAASRADLAPAEQLPGADDIQGQAAEEGDAYAAETTPMEADAARPEPGPEPEPPVAAPPAAAEPALAEKTLGRRMRITAFLLRQWYREVIRDLLPASVATLMSKAGMAVLGRKPAPGELPRQTRHAEIAPSAVEVSPDTAADAIDSAEAPTPLSADTDAIPEPFEPLPGPAENTAASDLTDPALPATALYLPVDGRKDDEPVRPAPRHLPARDDPPLPEPELAVFIPDPFPPARADPPRRETVSLDGMIFTAVLSPKDGRKNWQDILTAFVTTFHDTQDATLVVKMIGADAAFWWWEFHDIVKALPRFSCRVLIINGFLDDENYAKLIAATHFVVNASLAEGQCLPLVEFMSAGRPAIAPRHTAMLDYITPENALIVGSAVEFCSFPHDPHNMLTTTRHRIEWPSLCAAFAGAAAILRTDPARHAAMAENAASTMRQYCSDATAGPALASFLGFGDEVLARAGWRPRPRGAAEPLLAAVTEIGLGAAVLSS
jgi:hypothetical protein